MYKKMENLSEYEKALYRKFSPGRKRKNEKKQKDEIKNG